MIVIKYQATEPVQIPGEKILPGCEYQEGFIGRICLETSYYSALGTLVPPPL